MIYINHQNGAIYVHLSSEDINREDDILSSAYEALTGVKIHNDKVKLYGIDVNIKKNNDNRNYINSDMKILDDLGDVIVEFKSVIINDKEYDMSSCFLDNSENFNFKKMDIFV